MRFTQQLLECFGIESEKKDPVPLGGHDYTLPNLLRGILASVEPTRGIVAGGDEMPVGMVKVDSSTCTCCGSCARHCPTGALALSGNEHSVRLVFRQVDCIACQECVRACAEQERGAIRVERVLDLDLLRDRSLVLAEQMMMKCQVCGGPVASEGLIENLQGRCLENEVAIDLEGWIDTCPRCRATAMIG